MLLTVLFGIGSRDSTNGTDFTKLASRVLSLKQCELSLQVLVVEDLSKHFDLSFAHLLVLLVSLVEFFPVLHRDLLLEALEDGVSLLKRSIDVQIGLSTLDILHSLLQLDLRTVKLEALRCDKLLLLQVDQRSFFLSRLDKLLDLGSGRRILTS